MLIEKKYWPSYLTRWRLWVKLEKIRAVSIGVVATKWIDLKWLKKRLGDRNRDNLYRESFQKVFAANREYEIKIKVFFLFIFLKLGNIITFVR